MIPEGNSLSPLLNTAASRLSAVPTLEQTLKVFDEIADMEDIAFGHADGGCSARAHIMCRRLLDRGLIPRKAWAFEGEERLSVPSLTKVNGQELDWWYHVAPILNVEMPDKTVQDMVIDPSLFDGPVTLQEWLGVIVGAPPEKCQVLSLGVVPYGHEGSYKPGVRTDIETADRDAKASMEKNLGLQTEKIRKVLSSRSRGEFFQGQPERFQGKTWATVELPVPLVRKNVPRVAP